MARFLFLFTTLLTLAASPVRAQEAMRVIEWVEVRTPANLSAERDYAPDAIASYGPFRVVGNDAAALVGPTDAASPRQFAAMLADWPALATLELREAPGTHDDRANLEVGRMIRAAGLATLVPATGSVRSGAVELFLAGATRRVEDGASFAVHSWMDEDGNEAWQYPPDSPEHVKYLTYYRDMGFAADEAEAFYAMTNFVPHAEALWLDAAEMRAWIGQQPFAPTAAADAGPRIAYAAL